MVEDLYRKPLGKDESFPLSRETMGEIREGDLVESLHRTVTSIDEEGRKQILKNLDKQSVSARSALESIRVGLILDDAACKVLQERYGPLFKTKKEKWRIMYIYPHTGGATVWVGPPELTIEDAAIFKHQIQSGDPRSARFEQCRPVDMSEVKKVLDS